LVWLTFQCFKLIRSGSAAIIVHIIRYWYGRFTIVLLAGITDAKAVEAFAKAGVGIL